MNFFEPLPPPPPEPSQREWSPPVWDRPSEGTLSTTLAVNALLGRQENGVISIPSLEVYPSGFLVNVQILFDPRKADEVRQLMMRPRMRMGALRIGVRFADGRTGGQRLARGRLDLAKDEQGIPTQPYVAMHGGGGGGSGGWRFSAWVHPLPPDGPLEIFVALPPEAGGNEYSVTVDGSAVRSAANEAKVIWD